MRRMKMTNRWLTGLLALLLAVEPMLVPMLHAEPAEQNGQAIEEKPFDTFPTDRIPPGDYLKALLETRGSNTQELENRACIDWLLTIASSYSLMGAGEADVPVLYSTLEQVKKKLGDAKSLVLSPVKPIDKVSEYARSLNFVCSLLGKSAKGWGKRVLDSWEAWSKEATEGIGALGGGKYGKIMKVAKWISTPSAGSESKSYFRWLGNKAGLSPADDASSAIGNVQGVCQSIGIGLEILGLALNMYSFASSEDFQVGRASYSQVKTGVDIFFGLAGLACMFIPGGQIVALVTLIWVGATKIGDAIGETNKKWQEAYKNSWWYLMQEDPEFQSFYNNRKSLKDDEKAASLRLVEELMAGSGAKAAVGTARPGARAMIGKGEPGAEAMIGTGGGSWGEKQDALGEALERQATLVSYYYHTGCTIPDTDIEQLKKLWNAKAGYMSWKPQPQEEDKPWWKKELRDMAYDWYASRKYEKKVTEDKAVRRVWFNPDYVLIAKFLNYYMLTKEKSDLDEIIGLRIEQAPFNYLPLVEMGVADWSETLLTEAFGADTFCVGMKEMVYLREQMKLMKDAFDEGIDDAYKPFGDVRLDTARLEAIAKALETLVKDYAKDKDKKVDNWESRWGRAFSPMAVGIGKTTPAKFIAENRQKLEESLAMASNHTAQSIVDLISIGMTIKSARDTAALAEAVGIDRKRVLDNVDSIFTLAPVKRFLREGPSAGGGNEALNWLSDIYPPLDDMDKYVNLYQKDIDSYKSKIDKASKRDGIQLRELMVKYKALLTAFKGVTLAYEAIADEVEFTVHIPSTDTGVFDETFDFVADFDKPLQIDLSVTPGDGGGGGGGGSY